MAVETITFPTGNVFTKANGQGSVALTGTLIVDYTNKKVSGTLTDGEGTTYTGFSFATTGGDYVLNTPTGLLVH